MRINLILLIFLVFAYSCSGTLLLKKKKLIVGALAGKLLIKKVAPKALLAGGGLILGKKILMKLKRSKCCPQPCCPMPPCSQMPPCTQGPACTDGSGQEVMWRQKRSIREIVSNLTNDAFEGVSTRLNDAGSNMRNIGNRLYEGSQMINNASVLTRAAGVVSADRIRTGSGSLLNTAGELIGGSNGLLSMARGLIRERRAATWQRPRNFKIPTNLKTVSEMLDFVKKWRGQVCLKRIICQLRARADYFGNDGLMFGSRLLIYQNTGHEEANQYKKASEIGIKNNGNPEACLRYYPTKSCNYNPHELILLGNSVLANAPK